jgi:anti-sigma B factor antagonist
MERERGLSGPSVIAPEGELDVANVPDFVAALAEVTREATHGLVVDLSNVTFIDSAGLSALVDIHHRSRRAKRSLAIVAPAGTAAAVLFNLTGLDKQLPVSATPEAASEAERQGHHGQIG